MKNYCNCWLNLFLLFIGIFLFILKKLCRGIIFSKTTLIHNKVVIITGANTGLGKVTAIDLAKRGGKIYIACRDVKRSEEALKDIKRESGSDNIHFMQLDLSSIESIREFSQKFHDKEEKLHILINNAGLIGDQNLKTKDGFEMTMGVNHLGHFLLTHLLLDLLKASAPSRIINVSSSAYFFSKIEHDDFDENKKFSSSFIIYAKSKLANILFTRKLAKILKEKMVTVNCCHPGVIPTKITRNISAAEFMYNIILKPFLKTPVEGAQSQIRLAVDPDLEDVTGKYFENCKEVSTWKHANDENAADWLYAKSCKLLCNKLSDKEIENFEIKFN
ncbi:hypothetical protein PVAND_006799 [Polypedilum vanderplanki]|uniref:Uncharacterized protein n=1 Tax=Polypedilum vanderplanki TaxID=319348 RepID=A0A9J6C5A6_POLVA|nr:hypothetical protein PVAND_006799 [Polypedilum vanderplanki]